MTETVPASERRGGVRRGETEKTFGRHVVLPRASKLEQTMTTAGERATL